MLEEMMSLIARLKSFGCAADLFMCEALMSWFRVLPSIMLAVPSAPDACFFIY